MLPVYIHTVYQALRARHIHHTNDSLRLRFVALSLLQRARPVPRKAAVGVQVSTGARLVLSFRIILILMSRLKPTEWTTLLRVRRLIRLLHALQKDPAAQRSSKQTFCFLRKLFSPNHYGVFQARFVDRQAFGCHLHSCRSLQDQLSHPRQSFFSRASAQGFPPHHPVLLHN